MLDLTVLEKLRNLYEKHIIKENFEDGLQHATDQFSVACNQVAMKLSSKNTDVLCLCDQCPIKVSEPSPAGYTHGKAARGHPRTRWSDYISNLDWSRLGVGRAELSKKP